MRKSHRLFSCVAALWLVHACPALASSSHYTVSTDPSSGIEISVDSDFDNIPISGYAPVHVAIQNNSNRNGAWDIVFTSSPRSWSVQSSYHFTVESGQTRSFPILAQLSPSERYQNLSASVAGTGVEPSGRQVYFSTPNFGSGGPFDGVRLLGMSRKVGIRAWGPLKDKMEKRSDVGGMQFDATSLPEDWRGFSGLDWLCLSYQEWQGLSVPVRTAIRQWVGHGGKLIIASADPYNQSWNDFGLQSPGQAPQNYGYGNVRTMKWSGGELDSAEILRMMDQYPSLNADLVKDEPGWTLFQEMKEIGTSHTLILSFVLLFGVVVGPVNLFWLAPSSRRHRLFITTPLISLTGSLLLGALILVKDGTGGSGSRISVVQLFPDVHEEGIVQEQIVRTGLLLGSRFTTTEDVSAAPLTIEPDRYSQQQQYFVSGKSYSGDWFKSRYTQAQKLEIVRPSRAAVTVVSHATSGAPEIVSSIEANLETLVIADANKKWWQAHDVHTGVKVTMEPANKETVKQWWTESLRPTREATRKTIEQTVGNNLKELQSGFCASTSDAKGSVLSTLPTIRWQKSPAVYLGALVEKAEGGQAQ